MGDLPLSGSRADQPTLLLETVHRRPPHSVLYSPVVGRGKLAGTKWHPSPRYISSVSLVFISPSHSAHHIATHTDTIVQIRASLERIYNDIVPKLNAVCDYMIGNQIIYQNLQKHPSIFKLDTFTWDAFLWAYSGMLALLPSNILFLLLLIAFWTRCFAVDKGGVVAPSMVPICDAMNHSENAKVRTCRIPSCFSSCSLEMHYSLLTGQFHILRGYKYVSISSDRIQPRYFSSMWHRSCILTQLRKRSVVC